MRRRKIRFPEIIVNYTNKQYSLFAIFVNRCSYLLACVTRGSKYCAHEQRGSIPRGIWKVKSSASSLEGRGGWKNEARRFRSSNIPRRIAIARCLNSWKHYTANYRGTRKDCRAIICLQVCLFKRARALFQTIAHHHHHFPARSLRMYIYMYIYIICTSWEDIRVSLRLRR